MTIKPIIQPKDAKEYLASYSHDGYEWSLHFMADDFDDAEARIESIKRNLRLDGEVRMRVKLPTPIDLKWHTFLRKILFRD